MIDHAEVERCMNGPATATELVNAKYYCQAKCPQVSLTAADSVPKHNSNSCQYDSMVLTTSHKLLHTL